MWVMVRITGGLRSIDSSKVYDFQSSLVMLDIAGSTTAIFLTSALYTTRSFHRDELPHHLLHPSYPVSLKSSRRSAKVGPVDWKAAASLANRSNSIALFHDYAVG